jgi:predicted phage baseplate assembly protein
MNSAINNEVCRDEQRRNQVRARQRNGLDYVEVQQGELASDGHRGDPTIKVFFIGEAPADLIPANFRIDGGVRVRGIRVTNVERSSRGDDDLDDHWRLTLDQFGDFSPYTLRVVKPDAKGRPGDEPLDDFDPRYSRLDFTFKSECPSDLDCKTQTSCPPPYRPEPEINYLAKDYSSFRQLILDRLAVLMPNWNERHVPDLGITLVELLAYVGDYLSYYQDAVATEAYLDTARQRISVRRHCRLVDYQLHEGCNARAWVAIETSDDDEFEPGEVYFITGHNDALQADGFVLSANDLRDVPAGAYDVFEPLDRRETIRVYEAHNKITFYTWGDRECCLPRGSTRATLRYQWRTESTPEPDDPYYGEPKQPRPGQGYAPKQPASEPYYAPKPPPPPPPPELKLHLRPGDVLIFMEVKGPKTGDKADANPLHRHAVRLKKVEPGVDALYDKQIVEIEWSEEDALPFALCISSIGPADGCCEEITEVSVALGNVILVDHGRTVDAETFVVPAAKQEDAGCDAIGQPRDKTLRAAPFNPALKFAPLTHSGAFPQSQSIARRQAALLSQLMDRVDKQIDSLWRKAHDGQLLSTEELEALRVIFGAKAMTQAGLFDRVSGKWRKTSAQEQARAIAALINHKDRWLGRKLRRLATLRVRVEADYVLDNDGAREIGEMFGEQFEKELEPSNASLFGAASAATTQDPRQAFPAMSLSESRSGETVSWEPRLDLLDSLGNERHFVAETDNDGFAHLRFGDGEIGRAPAANASLVARYRVGNGRAGNVGRETISHIVFRTTKSGSGLRPHNPLPARGGMDPEPMAEAKLFAPGAFRKQIERAITAADYAELAERNHKIQRATASLRWTGSWIEASVAIDPLSAEQTDDRLLDDIQEYLSQYRRIGHDLRVERAEYVPLEIEMKICVSPHYLRGHVEAALLDVFSNRLLPNGKRGFFHPDNLTFGEGVHLSRLIAAAQAPGVESSEVTVLKRMFEPPGDELDTGVLRLGPLEIAQVDNDPSFPERGKFTPRVVGGR